MKPLGLLFVLNSAFSIVGLGSFGVHSFLLLHSWSIVPEVLENLLGITLKIDSPIPAWKLLITKLHAVVRRTCSVIDCCASLSHSYVVRGFCKCGPAL